MEKNNIIKVCKHHGELTKDQTVHHEFGRIRCKICIDEYRKKRYLNNKDKIIEYKRKWREKRKQLGLLKLQPKKQRVTYDPDAEGNIWKCKIHGWLQKEGLYFRKAGDIYNQVTCKECTLKKRKDFHKDNREILNKRTKEYRWNNIETVRKRDKERYYENIDKCREQARKYGEKNREILRIKGKIYRDNNKEKVYERNKRYIDENRDKVRERQRIYNKKKIVHFRKLNKEWKENHRIHYNAIQRKYQEKERKELHDNYIKVVLLSHGGFKTVKDIPPGFIEMKRALIKLKRKIKTIKENTNVTNN